MAKVVKRKPSEVKDVLLEHISRDIKALQKQQCDVNAIVDLVTSENQEAQSLTEHLEDILMHGLYRSDMGYWPFVSAFTRRDAVRLLRSLDNVKTGIGRGRAWLMLALNEQALESYLRIFLENQDTVLEYYTMEAFLRDHERMMLLVTLATGLDFMVFDLSVDVKYLDYAPSAYSEYGVPQARGTDLSIQPSFVSGITLETSPKQAALHSGNQLPPGTPPTILSESRAGPSSSEQSLSNLVMSDGAVVTLESPSQQSPTILDRFSKVENDGLVQRQRRSKGKRKKKKSRSSEGEKTGQQFEDTISQSESQEGVLPAEERQSLSPHRSSPDSEQVEFVDAPESGSFENRSWSVKPETGSVEPQKGNLELEAETIGSETIVSGSHTEMLAPSSNSPAKPVDKFPLHPNSHALATEPSTGTGKLDLVSSTRTDMSDGSRDLASIKDKREIVSTSCSQTVSLSEGDPDVSQSSKTLEPSLVGSYSASTADDGSSPAPEPTSSEEDPALLSQSGRKRSGAVSAEQKLGEDYSIIESKGGLDQEEPASLTVTGESTKLFHAVRRRPMLNEEEGHRADMVITDNIRLILSLEVFFDPEETIHRLVKVRVPIGLGRYQLSGLVITDAAVYLTQCDGVEGEFSRIMGTTYPRITEMIVGQSWQLLELVYSEQEYSRRPFKQVIVTGNEAVSRSIAKSIRITASDARPYRVNIPIIKDEGRGAMMSLELAKLSTSEPQAEILRYSLVHWEQLMGEPPRVDSPGKDRDTLSGSLQVKESGLFGKGWKMAYFSLIDGILHHYNSELDKSSKGSYPLRGLKCGGCMRARGEVKPFAFNVLDSNGSSLTLAASSEDQMTIWMQALCMAASGVKEVSTLSLQQGGLDCGVLLTNDRVNVLVEDMTSKSVQLVTSLMVEEITEIGIDKDIPLYCVLVYEDQKAEMKGMWMLSFSSEFELGQFEQPLATRWKDIYQVDIQFSEMLDPAIKTRAKRAIELFLTPRSDSITRGRTEFFP